MSDDALRADTIEAGHRKGVSKKSGLSKSGKDDRQRSPDKRSGEKVVSATGKPRMGALVGSLAAPLRIARTASRNVWSVWDRGYDNALARPVHAMKVLGATVAVVAVLGGLFWYQANHYSRLDSARVEAVKQGEGAVGRLMSYNFRNMDRQVEKTHDLVIGKFKDEYAQFINTKIAPSARNKQVAVQTSVDRSAVISSSTSEMVLLMYVTIDSEALLSSAEGSSNSGLRVTLEKEDGKWRVSQLTPV